ncbi:MAG TPA: hypothetical protein VGB74_06215 [Actinoplanes sp.]
MIDKRHSRGGPEVPRRAGREPLAEPTQLLRTIRPKTVLAPPPSRTMPPPPVAARAVIVYEPQVRRPWRLWVFTLGIVSLTVGVILGQAVAYQPDTRSSSNAQAGTVPADVVAPSASGQLPAAQLPSGGQEVSAPLGTAKTRVLTVTGTSALLRIRSADLGDKMLAATTVDASALPRLAETPQGPTLEVVTTGGPGSPGAEVQLNTKVTWTIKVVGKSTTQEIDMRAGGLAGLQFLGGATQVTLQLPKPNGTVPLRITEPISRLSIQTVATTPVRLRLARGADTVSVNGKVQQKVKAGSKLTPAKWETVKARYDLAATAIMHSVSVARVD